MVIAFDLSPQTCDLQRLFPWIGDTKYFVCIACVYVEEEGQGRKNVLEFVVMLKQLKK